jgi:AcrR family transcriptional regulator
VCETCASRGYDATTIADIVRGAGVSSRTFYKHFQSKQECFLAAYTTVLSDLQGRLMAAVRAEHPPTWPQRVAVGLRELLSELASHPTVAHMLFVDVLFAGAEARELRQRALCSYQEQLPLPPFAPDGLAATVLGGIVETIYHTILEGSIASLPSMYEELLYCLLVPLLGHEQASTVCASASLQLVS